MVARHPNRKLPGSRIFRFLPNKVTVGCSMLVEQNHELAEQREPPHLDCGADQHAGDKPELTALTL